jgi:hypothetical protein
MEGREESLNVYNMHNIIEKHFSISITPVRSRGGSLIMNIIDKNVGKVEDRIERRARWSRGQCT